MKAGNPKPKTKFDFKNAKISSLQEYRISANVWLAVSQFINRNHINYDKGHSPETVVGGSDYLKDQLFLIVKFCT